MATIEKTKPKKKKTRQISEESSYLSAIDIDFPTSTTDTIPSFECTIASQIPVAVESSVGEICNNDELPIKDKYNDIHSTETNDDYTVINQTQDRIAGPSAVELSIEHEGTKLVSKLEIQTPSAPMLSIERPSISIPAPDYRQLSQQLDVITVTEEIETKALRVHLLKPFTDCQLKSLYSNDKFQIAEKFEQEFISTELQANYQTHFLYDLLQKYFNYRINLLGCRNDLERSEESFKLTSDTVWTMDQRSKSFSGRCVDGIQVLGVEPYKFAIINKPIFESMSSNLSNMLKILCYSYTSHLYNCETLKLQIEQYITELIEPCLTHIKIDQSDRLKIQESPNADLVDEIQNIRQAVSILFTFIRRPIGDKLFSDHIREWIQRLVAVQIRCGTIHDHLFIVYHVLRCPPGISSWAVNLIHISKPDPLIHLHQNPFQLLEIQYAIVYLAIILLPVRGRNEFLQQHQIDNSESWTIIDSDGDDEHTPNGDAIGLKESDLVALFNQIPFKEIFRLCTLTEKHGNSRIRIDGEQISGGFVLKLLSFSTTMVRLLGAGLTTYKTQRYKQFSKILSRLIRHLVVYVTNMHDLYQKNSVVKDNDISNRIHIEYDTFVLRAAKHIYHARYLGAWQYLAILPYEKLYSKTLWKLYYCLNAGFTDEIIENITDDYRLKISVNDFHTHFVTMTMDIPSEDLYYLLQTFASMAMTRDVSDWELIQQITLDLFHIGFVDFVTKEICYKNVRDQLVIVTGKYQQLISTILTTIKSELKLVNDSAIYLLKSLPLNIWQPSMDDFELIASWLLNFSYETAECTMARTICGRLNWNFSPDGKLFLSHHIHIRMACLIVDVACKHVPETTGSSGISESVRQVSKLVKGQSTRDLFIGWCWTMISMLRLHCMDQSDEYVQYTLQHLTERLRFIPEIEQFEPVFKGANEARPIAIYVSLLISQWGHSVPQICYKGFMKLQELLVDFRHSIVLRCLHLMIPLFLECPESLSKCEKFQAILNNLLSSDRTYIKMAKELIKSDTCGPVVQLFADMIQEQICSYHRYGLQSPTLFVNLWLQCLTNLPNWTRDSNALHLIDLILKVSFQFAETWFSAKEYFRFLYKKTDHKPQSTTSFIPFFGSGSNNLIPTPGSNQLWLSLITLELEHEIFEIETKFWPELLRQLHAINTEKFSMDSVIKKTSSTVSCPNFSINSLVLYKWINLIIGSPIGHHLIPILCQRFFYLYLYRVPLTEDELRFTDVYGVADRFYDTNVPLMKSLKKYLVDTEAFYTNGSTNVTDPIVSSIYTGCSRLFQNYILWLEMTRLNKIYDVSRLDFPAIFDRDRLGRIFNRHDNYWTEFMHMPTIRAEQRDASNRWMKNCCRFIVQDKRNSCEQVRQDESKMDATEKIISHLNSYDTPIPPPEISTKPVGIKVIRLSDIKSGHVLVNLEQNFKNLLAIANQFHLIVQEFNSLNGTYKDLIRALYRNDAKTVARTVKCSSILSNRKCTGWKTVMVNITDPVIDEQVKYKLKNLLNRREQLIAVQMSAPAQSTIITIVQIQHSVRHLIDLYASRNQLNEDLVNRIIKISTTFFYDIINKLNESVNSFVPANDVCNEILSNLGIFLRDNQDTESLNLLRTAFNRPKLIEVISDLFVPAETQPQTFLILYKYIVDSYMRYCDKKILFVLLSKFDILKWIVNCKPKLADINQLINFIVQGLECWNQQESALIQDILRRHLVHIFEYDFPEHYGEILQLIIIKSSEQKLLPVVLHDLVNSIYTMAGCNRLNERSVDFREDVRNFATTQRLFDFQVTQETVALFGRHFKRERLQHGLHGLYPKHKDYCNVLAIFFTTFGSATIVQAVHAYPGLLADQLVEYLWPGLSELFSPWIVPYAPNQTMQSANWITQIMGSNQIMLPWSEFHSDNAQKIIGSFIDTIKFLLDTLPGSDSVIGHTFQWYALHFTNSTTPKHILTAVHLALIQLPWQRFQLNSSDVKVMHRILQQFLPECHAFVGHIFLRVQWTPWIDNSITLWNYNTRVTVFGQILQIFVKISNEPNVRENLNLSTILTEAKSFSWSLCEYQAVEDVFEWYIQSAEPLVILKLSSEYTQIDNNVLELLQIVCSMKPSTDTVTQQQSISSVQSKRILYVRNIVRMLKLCSSRNHLLLKSSDGIQAYQQAVIDLLDSICNVLETVSDRVQREIDSINLMIEIVCTIPSVGENTAKLLTDSLIVWQSHARVGNIVLLTTLNAIGACKTSSVHMYALLEATAYNYFRCTESSIDHKPTWTDLLFRLGTALPTIDGKYPITGQHLLSIHILSINKMKRSNDVGDEILYMQQLHNLLKNYKTNETTEPKLALIWSFQIVCLYQLLHRDRYSVTAQLLSLGRYFQTLSGQTDGWSDGLLGVIGLKKDSITNRRRILTRCYACIIFSLVPDELGDVPTEFQVTYNELKYAIGTKRFADVKSLAVSAIDIIDQHRLDIGKTKEYVCSLLLLFYPEPYTNAGLDIIWQI